MDIFEIFSHIEQTGYCVVESVIPVNEVSTICKEVITVQQAYHQQVETELKYVPEDIKSVCVALVCSSESSI